MPKQPKHLTPKKVADLCGCTPQTVYRWLDGGDVKGVRVGKKRYVDVKSLRDFLGGDAKKLGIEV